MGAQDNDLESLKVRVAFQAGQIELTLKQVEELAPGAILPINRTDASFLDVLANGKRIGSGELVKVGDEYAVRLTRLGSDE